MKNPDILFFFDGFPRALALYQALEDAAGWLEEGEYDG